MIIDKKRSFFALLALAVSAFAIGTTEFISVGLLPLISEDMNISVTTAGLTVSMYALGVTFGAPILTSLTSRMSRKTLLLWIMIIFIIGNSLAAGAASIGILLAARVLSAFSHGVFMSIGSVIAASVVPENRRASAISIMFTGLTVATVTGVPIGTFIGQQWGWRLAFVAIALVGVAAFIANSILIPSDMPKGERTSFRDQAKLLTNRRLLLMLLITALGYGGTFVVFTYLSPLLQDITGFKENTVAVILLVYGIAIALGNIIGGKAANRSPLKALLYMFSVQAVVLFSLTFTAPFKVAGFITIILMGFLAFMNVPGLQVYVVELAERFAPSAVNMASALNIAAFNAGIAIGSFLGGLITKSMGLIHTAWIGALMVFAAVALTGLSLKLARKDSENPDRPYTKAA
ncbi:MULTISPECIES: MFS transporter [Paenibacillus]|uniref:Major facilitator superfamily MFS_1 n=2 Tax=Paenibacillus lactis TaxID=228574 RepID=G4HGV2_9BACL|nr:MFS transporter [Paenibacillus lactis]EHB63975.1 major facilitator superfamily MFS_1 [Paenibacillus lactis 154]MBP1894996.1 putative MFS family arabinose efflux permease [Paenibacillus lactis]MCM3496765.1 MFS transporter [Paenibacillus lactis]GIO91980.1 putative MFS-type transporter YtbD [Paenibacillus lactis]HAF96774.1 MFS transporter [Paenibacillus lactis]